MRKQDSDEIPKQALNQKMFNDSQSQMFRVDKSEQININNVHFFNKDTQIIKQGQKRNVVYGKLEQERQSLYQMMLPYMKNMAPYVTNMASTTGNLATQAGQGMFTVMKDGFWWVYDKMANNIIPYAANQLPKILFIVTKKRQKKQFQSTDEFCVLSIDQDDKQLKVKIVIPLGQSDPQFEQFLKKEKFIQKYSFPIDIEDEDDQKQPAQSYMIPSQSFQVLYEGALQQGYKIPEKERVVHRLKDCAIFELEGKNTIQYDLLENIQRHQKSQSGYIVLPEKVIKNSSDIPSEDPDYPLETCQTNQKKVKVQESEQLEKEYQITTDRKQKNVDRTRNVRVQLPKQDQYNNKEEKRLQYA